ncbi:MAG: helix-turn-helix transcriptional regulator [Clostridia bacterium]|nr:helix-turn-helix transcriptional regulator [Clostridia bacterium]
MAFGDKLKELLDEKEISQKDFAAALNMAPTTLNGYIKNNRQPDFETIKNIATTLNVSIDFLLDYNKNNNITLSVQELSLILKIRKMNNFQKDILYELVNIIEKKSIKER